MPVRQIDIEIRAAAQRLRSDMDGNVKEVKRIGAAGQEAGKELAKGMETGAQAIVHVAKVASESTVALVGAQKLITAELLKYTTVATSGGSATETLVNGYRALRLALSPTPFTVATIATGILVEETIRLVNARAKLIEQQSLIAAMSGLSINAVQRIDAVTGISGGNAGNVRNLSSALSGRIENNQYAVRSGLDTLGVSATEGRSGSPMDPALLEKIAAGFDSIEDPAKRAAAAVALFGAENADTALKELDSAFVDASQGATKFGVVLDETSRNQIYRARQEFVHLQDALTQFGGMKAWWESFKLSTEICAAAAEDMARRGTRSLHDLIDQYVPGMRELNALIHPGTPLTPAELNSGNVKKSDILTGLNADEMYAHEVTLSHADDNTLEGQKAQQAAAQAKADAAFQTLTADMQARQANPKDPSLLSNEQRFGLAVAQQSNAALATAIGEKVAAMEAAAAAQKKAQAAAEQLAVFQGKSGERLQALSDQVTAKAMADDPVSAARWSAYVETNRDSDRTTPAERAARAKILQVEVDRIQAAEEEKRASKELADVQKQLADEFTAMGNPLGDLLPTKESSSSQGRLDSEAESRQRDAGERAIKLAGIQSQPGSDVALAQRVLDIRLQTVAAERAILAAHSDKYTLEDLTLASEKLTTEALNAQLTYEDSIAEIEKAREQSALSTGGSYQLQLRTIQQQLDALNQIKVTDQNINDIELARVALSQKAAQAQIQELLALGTLKDGWDAFWLEQQQQAEKPGKILYDGLNDAENKLSGDFAKLATGQHKKTTFGKDLQSVGDSMVQASMKAIMQKGLGALGKKIGIHPTGKPDGTAQNPYHVIVDGNGTPKNPLSGMPGMGQLPPAFGGAAKSAGSGILGWLGGLFGKGGGGGGTAVDSSIEFMASGTDNADPGHVYGVAEAGEAELISPKNSSRITPISKLMGGSPTYNIDARGADLGAENRVSRAIEAAHNSAVGNAQRADAERAKRTPKRR